MRSPRLLAQQGFSLTELLVALVFTGLLMAGLSQVYRSSISSFRQESEKLTSSRRNRIAMEILNDDLGLAGQALSNIVFHTSDVNTSYPLFAVFPDQDPARVADEQRDQLQFFFEEALPFEGRFYSEAGKIPVSLQSSNEAIGNPEVTNEIKATALDEVQLNFKNTDFRDRFVKAVKAYANTTSPINLVAKDSWRVIEASGAREDSKDGTTAYVSVAYRQDRESGGISLAFPLGKKEYTHWVGAGSYGTTDQGAAVTIVRPRLLARYTIEDLAVDPSAATKTVPCLVRTVKPYDAVDTDPGTRTVVAEDVQGLKVSVSVNNGTTWIGGGTDDRVTTASERLAAWNRMKLLIDDAISKIEDPSRAKALSDGSWYRYFPMLLRLDVTTRTANPRANAVNNAPAYIKQRRVLVSMPRYFGMPLTSTQ